MQAYAQRLVTEKQWCCGAFQEHTDMIFLTRFTTKLLYSRHLLHTYDTSTQSWYALEDTEYFEALFEGSLLRTERGALIRMKCCCSHG